MELDRRNMLRAWAIGVGLSALSGVVAAQPVAPPASPRPQPLPPDPRVGQRTYRFGPTGEDLPYAVFVSSKVRKDKPAPLIIALHGLNGNHNTLMRGALLDLAEKGGYVVVAPMGYNPRGWYGIPGEYSPRAGLGRTPDPAAAHDPPNLRALSEQDVMNVLALAKQEFRTDPARTFLVGHSMGGAGALYLASKYPKQWNAVAAIAPATRRMVPRMQEVLSKITVPVMITQGVVDQAVPVDMTRTWIDAMEERKMIFRYEEIQDADHRTVIDRSMLGVFAFLERPDKP
ncbi:MULTISPECIES: alpha/beta hydrolase-fold protein [Burkholderiales]|jgi:dienelactone hydrolase|uniref:Acyl-CoA:diacylglycerol acyltransferase n=3 Tax=Burkholderiales TaxID=80840 RepID=A0ABZ0CXH6_9BURK|nr:MULTISPECIES: alpha/beta hydrolase-fold protein [Burkholderiales]MBP6895733.1 alpha/beta hydrolase [Pseudacidovorax sp.]WFF81216.1 alpha/beta hydrolase-fold protein [Delftia tsuruhatensis]WOB09669.1 alpha/beta hydrolase-fold protein [Piscinibacter gummiphilus]